MNRILYKFSLILIVFFSLFFLTGGGTQEELAPEVESRPSLSGGIVLLDISSEPVKKIRRFQPLADYLADNLAEFGIGSGEVKIAPDIETAASWISSGEVDLYFDSLYPAMMVCDQSGARPILRRWKKGVSEYHTVFFALSNSGLHTLADLPGQMIAFEEPYSTSGYMLPLAYLIEEGLNPVEKSKFSLPVSEDETGYVFAGEDQNAVQWVLSGRVAACVLDNDSFNELPEDTRSAMNILGETESVVRQVVVVRSDMDSLLVQEIKRLLLVLDETEEGRAVLEIFKTSQFDDFPGGEESALTRMWELYELALAGNKR